MAPRHESQVYGRPANILVVEDEILIRLDIARELAGAGYRVIEAANAGEAIAILEGGHAVDLVFSDIQMPGPVDGIGLLGIVRQRFPSIPVVLPGAHGWTRSRALSSSRNPIVHRTFSRLWPHRSGGKNAMTREQLEESGQSVLLIEGEVLARHELAEYLRHCGYDVIEASTTDEAVTVLSTTKIGVDAVLCSAEALGEMNGFALASWARSNRPGLPVLLAGNHDKAAAAAGELCDQGPELARPYDPAIVLGRIRRRLAARERNRGK